MSEREKFTAWITKYALTEGILKMLVEDIGDGAVKKVRSEYQTLYFGEGREWHRTLEGAFKRANEMQDAKLKSIDKQRARIAALKFEA